MSTPEGPRYGIDPYLDWVAGEGIPIVEDYGIDLFAVETKLWARAGVCGAAVHLKGRGDFCNMFVYDIGPGTATAPQRHLYEDVIYVLEGSGSTQIELSDGTKRSFEWGPRALFAIPLNARHRHFNASGVERALLVSTTDLPLVMNTFHNERFIFDTDFDFLERVGKSGYFSGEGDLLMVRPGNHIWETNFVPDLAALDELKPYDDRGAGSTNIKFVLADGVMHAHISEIPSGTYKKGHRHGPGYHVMCVTGHGYSLLWYPQDEEFRRIDWKHGVVLTPGDQQFHQHFNTSQHPARYLATALGSQRYPLTQMKRRLVFGAKPGEKGAGSTSLKKGGNQIEYEDQDPRIHRIWLDEMKEKSVEAKMEKFIRS